MARVPSQVQAPGSRRFLLPLGALLIALGLSQSGDAALRASADAPVVTSPTVAGPDERQSFAVAAKVRHALDAAVQAHGITSTSRESRDLVAFYELAGGKPAWIDDAGRLTRQARAGLTLVEQAVTEGLDPADYAASELATLAARLEETQPVDVERSAEFDVLLSASLLRYCRHLHLGRIDPRALGLRIPAPDEHHDFAIVLRAALEQGRLAEAVAELAPPLAQHRALRTMLGRYRQLASDLTGEHVPVFADTVRAGDVAQGLPALHRLLLAVGDLPAGTPPPASGVYDATLRSGIIRFQERHGLEPDGVIGRATRAALAVPLPWRVRQIEMALERLRWLPDLSGGRTVAVNIPMYRLWAWDQGSSDDAPALTMPVIVGRALDTKTPVLAESLEHVIFRPYWNVPTSILRDEMLPILRRDPGYLDKQDLEIVQGPGDNATVLPPTAESIARLGTDGVRLRQRPGPKNALGLVKFVFPNDADVYMHDTPAPQLFKRARRDLSHGCIRVADPVALAEWVLRDDPAWTREQILAAMNDRSNKRVDLPQPIQVIIVYTTAGAATDDGRMHFAEDVYGQDVVLDEALSGVRKTVQASPGADASGVDVHEIRGRVVADAAPLEVARGRPQPGERHVGHANVDGLPLHVQAAGGDAFALLSQGAVRGGRPVA